VSVVDDAECAWASRFVTCSESSVKRLRRCHRQKSSLPPITSIRPDPISAISAYCRRTCEQILIAGREIIYWTNLQTVVSLWRHMRIGCWFNSWLPAARGVHPTSISQGAPQAKSTSLIGSQ